MEHSDNRHWLALYHAPGLSDAATRALVERCGSAAAVCAAGAAELHEAGVGADAARFLKTPGGEPGERLAQDLRWLERDDASLIAWGDARYPKRLSEIKDPPLLLFVMGDVALLDEPQLAVIGTRRPTPGGLENTRRFAESLARSGLIVVSGLAAGIDAAAHQAALGADAPTIAVIGTGPDIVYPAKHQDLAHRIVGHGAVVSEFSCGTPPHRANFPRRNRLMSGMAYGVLVVEASDRSGSLITARLAGEQGREVFAVPGSIRNPAASGCHRLIQQGAKLVTSARDILIELKPQVAPVSEETAAGGGREHAAGKPPAGRESGLDAEHRRLLDCMSHDEPVGVDALVERSGLTAAEVSSMLLIMELEGYVSCDNHLYARVK